MHAVAALYHPLSLNQRFFAAMLSDGEVKAPSSRSRDPPILHKVSMVAFDDQVRAFLEGVERAPSAPRRSVTRVDDGVLRAHFLELLGAAQQSDPKSVERRFRQWDSRLEAFARYLEMALDLSSGDVQSRACQALNIALGFPAKLLLVEQLELERLVDAFDAEDTDVMRYALENRLVRSEGVALHLTGLGRVFLHLQGKALQVQWLLTIEVAQSRGRWDEWRADRELLADASALGIRRIIDDEGGFYFPCAERSLKRLIAMHVLSASSVEGSDVMPDGSLLPLRYSTAPAMRGVVASVIDRGLWHSAVAALVEDERALVFRSPMGATASEAAMDQARLIAHEVRNALVPVRHHIDSILTSSMRDPPTERLEAVKRGVVRTLDFVEKMVTMTEVVSEPVVSFDVFAVIREALSWQEGVDRVEFEEGGPLLVQGPRSRLTRALSNVLLNALQSTPEPGRVRITVRSVSGGAELRVDDAGPGVPPLDRVRVFEDGFTTRASGSGFGLAFTRRVVEDLYGRVWCEESDLGGARFVIVLGRNR